MRVDHFAASSDIADEQDNQDTVENYCSHLRL